MLQLGVPAAVATQIPDAGKAILGQPLGRWVSIWHLVLAGHPLQTWTYNQKRCKTCTSSCKITIKKLHFISYHLFRSVAAPFFLVVLPAGRAQHRRSEAPGDQIRIRCRFTARSLIWAAAASVQADGFSCKWENSLKVIFSLYYGFNFRGHRFPESDGVK